MTPNPPVSDRFTQKRVEELELKIRELLSSHAQEERFKWEANKRAEKAEAAVSAQAEEIERKDKALLEIRDCYTCFSSGHEGCLKHWTGFWRAALTPSPPTPSEEAQ